MLLSDKRVVVPVDEAETLLDLRVAAKSLGPMDIEMAKSKKWLTYQCLIQDDMGAPLFSETPVCWEM